jgi:hypothetical protein
MKENKLISFILNDIKELEIITKGMLEMDEIPSVMHLLAVTKTQNLLEQFNLLKELDENSVFAKVVDAECVANKPIAKEVVVPVADEKSVEEDDEFVDDEFEDDDEFDEFDDDESDYLVIGSESDICDAPVVEEPKPVEPSKVEEPKLEPAPEVASEPAKVAEPEKKVVDSVPDVNVGTVIAEDKLEVQKCVSEVSKVKSKPQVRTTGSRKAEGRFVNSLKKAITINDRIRYTRELFGGDMELMNKVIVHLDGLSSLKEATDYIESIFDWDELDEAVIEFYDLLEMRFS